MKVLLCSSLALFFVVGCSKDRNERVKFFTAPVPNPEREILEEVNRDSVKLFLESLTAGPGIEEGKLMIHAFLKANYPSFNIAFFDSLDLHALQSEILEGIREPLVKHPPRADISTFFFGLYDTDKLGFTNAPHKDVTVLYLCGTNKSPDVDRELLTMDAPYFPAEEYYMVPTAIVKIKWELHRYSNYEVVEDPLIGGIVALVLANSVDELKTLIGKPSFNLATGYDEGITIMWKV